MWVFHSHAGHLGGGTNASGVEQYVFVPISGTPEARGEISAMQTKGTGEKIAHKWRQRHWDYRISYFYLFFGVGNRLLLVILC